MFKTSNSPVHARTSQLEEMVLLLVNNSFHTVSVYTFLVLATCTHESIAKYVCIENNRRKIRLAHSFFVWNAANENTTNRYRQANSWFVCNHLATTKRKECNLKTELQKIIAKTKNENKIYFIFFHKTNKVQLKSFEMYVSIWAFANSCGGAFDSRKTMYFRFCLYIFWFVVNYRSWIMSEIVRISINQNADFTHVSANYRSNAI